MTLGELLCFGDTRKTRVMLFLTTRALPWHMELGHGSFILLQGARKLSLFLQQEEQEVSAYIGKCKGNIQQAKVYAET